MKSDPSRHQYPDARIKSLLQIFNDYDDYDDDDDRIVRSYRYLHEMVEDLNSIPEQRRQVLEKGYNQMLASLAHTIGRFGRYKPRLTLWLRI